jgi:hypothetical protein
LEKPQESAKEEIKELLNTDQNTVAQIPSEVITQQDTKPVEEDINAKYENNDEIANLKLNADNQHTGLEQKPEDDLMPFNIVAEHKEDDDIIPNTIPQNDEINKQESAIEDNISPNSQITPPETNDKLDEFAPNNIEPSEPNKVQDDVAMQNPLQDENKIEKQIHNDVVIAEHQNDGEIKESILSNEFHVNNIPIDPIKQEDGKVLDANIEEPKKKESSKA